MLQLKISSKSRSTQTIRSAGDFTTAYISRQFPYKEEARQASKVSSNFAQFVGGRGDVWRREGVVHGYQLAQG